jgi:hypothetical protein
MKIIIATCALIISLAYRIIPENVLPLRKKKKVLSKKQNSYLHRCLQARIHTLQVIGDSSTFYDSPDN